MSEEDQQTDYKNLEFTVCCTPCNKKDREFEDDIKINKEVTEFAFKDVNNWLEGLMKRVKELERLQGICERSRHNHE